MRYVILYRCRSWLFPWGRGWYVWGFYMTASAAERAEHRAVKRFGWENVFTGCNLCCAGKGKT